MAAKKKSSKGKERPPPVDKLLKPAIVVVIAILVFQFFKGINSEVLRVNTLDELELRETFFGEGEGKNYAVLCHAEDAKYPVSSVFQDASNDGSAPAEFRLLDCDHVLSSEKTVYERFKLNKKQRPVVFVSGKSGPPKQVPSKFLKTGPMLVKALKNLLVPKAEKIETTQDLRTKCLDKDICGLLLKGGKQSPNYVKDAMSKLLVEFPKVAFAAVDTSVLYVKGLEAEYLPEFVSGQPRFVVFQKIAGSTAKDGGRLKTSLATLPSSGVGYGPMSNLIAGVVQKTQDMTKVSTLPTIKTRTKKLEEEERAKRNRRLEQQKRKEDPSAGGGTTGGYFHDNDGTKEGRKAERDKRREEHRKNNPNYREKTPEEIAEIERRRRQRMEEEAAKWNMAPEDMPEEGEPVGQESFMEDDEEYDVNEEDEDKEDEDVMDLD